MKWFIKPDEVWNYFEENKESLATTEECIFQDDTGLSYWITGVNGKLGISVVIDDLEVLDENLAEDEESCIKILKDYAIEYLDDSGFSYLEKREENEAIETREMELFDAVDNMLHEFAPDIDAVSGDSEMVCENLVELICGYLYKEHSISVYRPMFLESEFVEYPYDVMDF